MTSRKRPLAEISQPYSTPARYAPSTPHALRALQQRSGAKQRSAHSIRYIANRPSDTVRPDGSARNILKQFAKITAPLTKKRISTPVHTLSEGKENEGPEENEDDSVLLRKPQFTIEESIEEDDSELPVAPTPSVLPDDENGEEPTITFQNFMHMHNGRPASERIDRRRSRVSLLSEGGQGQNDGDDGEQEADATIMTERGRRAISEEATGRFSRYSFGSIRMSDFGTELEIRRESNQGKKMIDINDASFASYGNGLADLGGETEDLRGLQKSPDRVPDDDSVQIPDLGDETFNLQLPDDDDPPEEVAIQHHHAVDRDRDNQALEVADMTLGLNSASKHNIPAEDDVQEMSVRSASRRQTLLESATATAQTTRRKRVKLTRHGTEVPSLPASLIKWIATETQSKAGKRKSKLGRDHAKALEQATEWYFEQVGEDLAAYADHGRRKKRVDTDDVLLLMRRQKVLSNPGDLRKLAKDWLPKDLLDNLDLPDQP